MSATRCPSELVWSRHLAGDLGWIASRRLRAHVAGCARCRGALQELSAERAAFSADPRRRRELAELQARAHESVARGGSLWVLAGVAAAASAAIAVFVFRAPDRDPEWSIKGGDLLAVHVQTASGAVPLGATCAAGDRLMASWATEHTHLLLVERDGGGRMQVLLPPGGTASILLSSPRGTTPQSFVLDAAKGPECFAAFFSDEPIDAARAAEALAGGGRTPRLAGAVVRMACCEKEGGR